MKNATRQLEQYIDQYDKILLLDLEGTKSQKLVVKLLEYLPSGTLENKKILVMSKEEVSKKLGNGVDIVIISPEQMMEFVKLFRTYEFSDRVSVVSASDLQPSLLNYLNTGILSEAEVFETMLR